MTTSKKGKTTIHIIEGSDLWVTVHPAGVIGVQNFEYEGESETPCAYGEEVFIGEPELLIELLQDIMKTTEYQQKAARAKTDKERREALDALCDDKFGPWGSESDIELETPADDEVEAWLKEVGLDVNDENRKHIQLVAKTRYEHAVRAQEQEENDDDE